MTDQNKFLDDRRDFLKAMGAGITGVSLAGCMDGQDGNGGNQTNGGNGDGDPLKVGVLANNPSESPVGGSIQGGAEVAAAELNQNGGVLGREVQIITRNTEETASGARNAYQQLNLNQDVDLTVGVFTSEALLAIIDDIADAQKLHFTTGAGTPEVSQLITEDYERYKYHFRPGPFNSIHLGQSLVDFAEEFFQSTLGWESVSVLIEDAAWSGPGAEVVEQQLPNLGFDVTNIRRYPLQTSNFSPIYDEIEGEDPDGVYTMSAHAGVNAALQWYQEERPFGLGGIHVPAQFPQIWDSMNGSIEYVWTQTSAVPGVSITEKTQPFTEAFINAVGTPPVYTGYTTYDAVHLFAAYAEEAGTTDPEELIPMIETNEVEYTGTTAEVVDFYGPDDDYPHDPVYTKQQWLDGSSAPVWIQWQEAEEEGGDQVTFAPDSLSNGEYMRPEWI